MSRGAERAIGGLPTVRGETARLGVSAQLWRVLQQRIIHPLAPRLLEGEPRDGAQVVIEAEGGRFVFRIGAPSAPEGAPAADPAAR